MWVFTKDGFFSTVQDKYCDHYEVMVRARHRDDLLKLCERLKIESEILEFPNADYQYRIKIGKTDWSWYLEKMASEIDYPNFKVEVARLEAYHLELARLEAYHECWRALLTWQERG